MAKTHSSFDMIIGCACNKEIVKQEGGKYLIKMALVKDKTVPYMIYYTNSWYKCPQCDVVFIPKIDVYPLESWNSIVFERVLENAEVINKPIYEWFWI